MAYNNKIKAPELSGNTGQESIWEKWLRTNPNNFSYWFPHVASLDGKGISVPHSEVVPVPTDVLNAFFMEKEDDAEKVNKWVTEAVAPVISEKFPAGKLFIKNGCFSGKIRFSESCLIEDPSDIVTLTKHISNIQYDSLCLDTCGNLEMVLREYIEPEPDTPTIYHGMPLRPEVRIFYNFDSHRYLYAANYWDWKECHDGICRHKEDGEVYENIYPSLREKLARRLIKHLPSILRALDSVDTLKMPNNIYNIWSVDFILEEDRAWLIDMAVAWHSAYWNKEKAGL